MQEYYGTKCIAAKPMTRAQYNEFRGWTVPANEDGADDGYLVEYQDGGKPNVEGYAGYVSWSPKEQFENVYQPIDALSFGHALEALKAGKRVARAGWNGKGMWIAFYSGCSVLIPAGGTIDFPAIGHEFNEIRPYLGMKTVDNEWVPWTISQSDALANDWQIIEVVQPEPGEPPAGTVENTDSVSNPSAGTADTVGDAVGESVTPAPDSVSSPQSMNSGLGDTLEQTGLGQPGQNGFQQSQDQPNPSTQTTGQETTALGDNPTSTPGTMEDGTTPGQNTSESQGP